MEKVLALSLFLVWIILPGPIHSQEDDPRELFAKAYSHYAQGELSEAEALFRKTLDLTSPLEDYCLYFLAVISRNRGDQEGARALLSLLKEKFPRSVWSPQADLQMAKTLVAEKAYERAIEALQALRNQSLKREVADEALYLLGEIHEQEGELRKSYASYQELRRASPLSAWAAKARKEVKRLREEQPQLFSLAKVETLADEAELLLKEQDYPEAERAYRKLLDLVSDRNLRPRFLMGMANVYRGARKPAEGIPVLAEIVREYPESPEAPTALYRLGRTYWNRNDNLMALDHFRQLKKSYPKSGFVDFVEFASARIYESLARPADALGIYRDFSKRFPESSLREEAQWRLAWIHYLQADYRRAVAAFKSLAVEKGDRYKTAALYWQGRAAEKMGRVEEAREIFLDVVNGQQDSYYAGPASKRLGKMGVSFEEKVTKSRALPVEPSLPPSPNFSFHLSRAEELAQISLNRLAVAELDAIKPDNGDLTLKLILMREYARNQAYDRSVALANGIHNLSEELDRYRYPLSYWDTVQKNAAERDLDPYLVVALIRQESLFNPKAVSTASAHGLMQLLPSTAARIARQMGDEPPGPEKLFDPDLNLTLGTRYLKELFQRYANNPVRAIAAYNAGENAVDRWEKEISAEDDEELVERIPYGETRLYVKLVLRNYRIYRKIYDTQK